MNSVKNKQKGFTIIEVVLVLAIAGLIFLVVFLALPALQRQQRDTQRRNDASRVSTVVTNFQSNNGGKLPAATDMATLSTSYLKNTNATGGGATGELKSPSTQTEYAIDRVTTNTAVSTAQVSGADVDHIQLAIGFRCDGEALVTSTGRYAVRVLLENGGTYCIGSN